jgi:hypothetical protein
MNIIELKQELVNFYQCLVVSPAFTVDHEVMGHFKENRFQPDPQTTQQS